MLVLEVKLVYKRRCSNTCILGLACLSPLQWEWLYGRGMYSLPGTRPPHCPPPRALCGLLT